MHMRGKIIPLLRHFTRNGRASDVLKRLRFHWLGRIDEAHLQHRLRPVDRNGRRPAARLRRRVDLQAQLRQHLARQIAAAPVEHQPRLLLAQRLVDPARGLLRLRPRQVLQLVVKLPAVRAGRGRIQQRPVVAEDLCIVEIEIVIARAVLTEGIVKRGVQMIALPAELDDVPGVQVALAIGGPGR